MTDKAMGLTEAIRKMYSKEFENGHIKKDGHLDRLKNFLMDFKNYLKENPWALWFTRLILIIMTAVFFWGIIHYYNLFSSCKNNCELYYAQVGVEFKRRQNLIPNLVFCVSGYSEHEKEIMQHVSNARKVLSGTATINAKMDAIRQMEGAVSKLLAIVEQYPALRASETTQTLLKELSNTEDRVAEWKLKFNESALAFNNLFYIFPTNYLAHFYGYGDPIQYIATDEDLLKVSLVKFEEKTNP